ncbi:hypothetical protein F5141DRAFT_1063056 [Pisolithus sp. B1]|nr:hypothetical protein F5141DRAFT_1063056 [Pisolithus sp. B1]
MATFPSEVAQALPLPNGVLRVGIWPADPLGAMQGTVDRLEVNGGLVGMVDDVKPTASVVGAGGCTCSPTSYRCSMHVWDIFLPDISHCIPPLFKLFCLIQPAQVDDQHFENGEDAVDSILECQLTSAPDTSGHMYTVVNHEDVAYGWIHY